MEIAPVDEGDLPDLLALMRGYCNFYVVPAARGTGVADELIARCRALAAEHGAGTLAWQTAKDNARARAVYDRVGGVRAEWIDFHLPTTG